MMKSVDSNVWDLIVRSMRRHGSDLWLVLIYGVVIGLLYLITPIAIQELVNIVAFGVYLQPLLILTGVLVVGLLLLGALRIYQRFIVEVIQQRIFVHSAFEVAEKVRLLNKNEITRKKINLFFEVPILQKTYSKLLLDGLGSLLQAGIGLLTLAFYHPFFIVYVSLLLISIVIVLLLAGRGGIKTALSESNYKYEFVNWLQELGSSREVFKFSDGVFVRNKTDDLNVGYLRARSQHFAILIRQNIASILVQTVASASLLALGGWLVIEGQMTLGQLIAAELVITFVISALDKLILQIESFFDLTVALIKLDSVLSISPKQKVGQVKLSPVSRGMEVVCRGLEFGYEMDSSNYRPLLTNLNLKVASGEWIEIDGNTGSGKSTMLSLVSGFSSPTAGRIYFDEHNRDDIDPVCLGREVSILHGDASLLFDASLADNIILGRQDTLPLKRILEIAAIDRTIDGFPRGEDTHIISEGRNLSSSQVLQVLTARALAYSPRLILIHPQFANLTEELRYAILSNIRHYYEYVPTLIVFGGSIVPKDYLRSSYLLDGGALVRV